MSEGKISTLRVSLLGVALVALGTLGFHEIPGMIAENAEGTKLVNAFYCAIITLTTCGYGDICPGDISGPGRTFIVFLAFSGLGFFCGPIMDLTSSWKEHVPVSGAIALASLTMITAVFVFSYLLEEMSESEAAYFSIITGTTIGYGDITVKSDAAKLAVALYAVVAINVVASLLQPAKEFLLSFCIVKEESEMQVKLFSAPSKNAKSNDDLDAEPSTEGAKSQQERKRKTKMKKKKPATSGGTKKEQ